MKVNSTPKCIWPEGQVDGGRPSLARMEELLPCTLSEVPDGFFCNAILDMDVDPTDGETLPLCTAAVLEGVVCKLSIVAVVVEDMDVVLVGKVLEGTLGFHVVLAVVRVVFSASKVAILVVRVLLLACKFPMVC